MNYIHLMTYHPSITETGFARLRAAVARAAARALGLDRMKALLIAQIQAAIAQIEALLAAWQNGTLPPAPQAPPSEALPLATQATEPAAPIPAAPARTPSSLFHWPLFSRASLGEAVLGWLLPPLPAARRMPGHRRVRPLQARPAQVQQQVDQQGQQQGQLQAGHSQAAPDGPASPFAPAFIRTQGPTASAPARCPSRVLIPPGTTTHPSIIRRARPPPPSLAKSIPYPQGRCTPKLLR